MSYAQSAFDSLRVGLKTMLGSLTLRAALVVAGSLIGGTALALHLGTRFVSSTPSEKPKAQVTIHAADRGKPIFNFADGRQVKATYRGNVTATQFLQSGQARPRAMATTVLAGGAVPNLISGYSGEGMGVVTVQHGNPEAFAPKDESVYPRIQQGYNPDALLPETDTYLVPQSADFVQAGDFNYDGRKDVLTAARGGDLFLLAGDGRGRLETAVQIPLPGNVTAMAAGEFRVVDGWTDLAVSVDTPSGPMLLIFDGASALSGELASFPLKAAATAMQFADLDHDAFQDLVLAAGDEVLVIHGWSRKGADDPNSRVERTSVGYEVRDLAVGFFIWSRQAYNQIAVLSADGDISMLDRGSDTRPYTAEEAALFHRSKIHKTSESVDPELLPGWQRTQGGNWKSVRQVSGGASLGADSRSQKILSRAKISFQETDELLLVDKSNRKLDIVLQGRDKDIIRPGKDKSGAQSDVASQTGDLTTTRLDTAAGAIAVQEFPQKINGERNLFVMQEGSVSQEIVPLVVSNPIVVDRIDDPNAPIPAGCDTAVLNDCSLRGAIQALNANPGRPITLPAGTYTLTINGTSSTGCEGNSVGDLGINASTTITGAGSGSTIIRQHGTNVGNIGDRVICLNETVANSINYTINGVTIIGGRDSSTWTAGGIIGGGHLNSLTLNNVVIANNQASNTGTVNTGGGGIQIVGGPLTINNSTIGGSSAPTTYDPTNFVNRDSTTAGNLANVSGGGINFDPSSGTVVGTVGNFTVTSTTFNNNRSGSTALGGGGVDINNQGFGSGGGGTGVMEFNGCTFSNNQATGGGTGGNGGALVIEALTTTIKSLAGATSFTSNSGTLKGGAIANTGGTLTIDGTSANGITFSSNTAPSGSSIFTNNAATLMGTNTTVGGSIFVATNGTWTNVAGSAISPTDFSVFGGTLNCNNSTMNLTGNFTLGKETTKGGVVNANTGIINVDGNMALDTSFTSVSAGAFNAGSGTVNLKGNLSVVLGTTPNNGTFNAGTGTFNFNGTAVQTITNSGTGSPITFNLLTDSNITQTLDVTNSINVNNTLNVNEANAILNPAAAAIIGGTGTLTGTGTARATRTAATADFLTQYTITNKTFTNLTIDYNGAGNQTVNNTPAYSHLRISGSGTKTLQGATSILGSLTIAAAALDVSASNFGFNLDGNWTNSVGAAGFVPRSGTVTFDGTGVVQALSGNTTFFNLTLNNNSSSTQFGASTTTTIQNNLVTSLGSMLAATDSTVIFTGAAGSISGAIAKQFYNLQINTGATISNSTGGDTTILNDYTNNGTGTYTQAAGLTTTFATSLVDGIHNFSGSGTTTFGVVTINGANTVNAGSHNFSVLGASFTANGTFNGDTGGVTFNGGVAQSIAGTGPKNFNNLTINNGNGVSVTNVGSTVDASVGGLLTLTTDLTVAASAILQQSGTSGGAGDVIGTVRRADLGTTARPFGNANNTITIVSGTAPNPMDVNLVKLAPGTFPAGVDVIPRTYTLTPTGGSGISATVKLRYLQTEVGGADENQFILWKNLVPWTPQGGTVDTANNFVSLSGVSSFSEWAIAEGSDLTLTKANDTGNAAVTGEPWNWTLTATNTGAPATFSAGQTILSDNLPNSNLNYGTPTVQNVSNITGFANISCSITSNDLTCTASGASVTFDSNLGVSKFDVVFSATPQTAGSYQNPRSGGAAQVDPNNVSVESAEGNNTAANNTVTVSAANTTTTISNDASLTTTPSVTGQAVTVQWNVAVNAPGSLGTALTGNVTVSDGTNNCVAAVSAGQCDITFTSAGAKNITATYAGDSNYNTSASTPATPHTVNAADTTTTITLDSPDPSTPGQSVTVNYTVTATPPGGGIPAGNVNVTVSGGAETCSGTVAAGTCALVLNTTGNRTITATYVGPDSNFNGSFDTETHDVCGNTLVTTTAGSGAGSLREVLAGACDGATITFDTAGAFNTAQTITLGGTELSVAKNVTIDGPDAAGNHVTVSGGGLSRVFSVNSGKTVAISDLTVTNGATTGAAFPSSVGGGIFNEGTLTLTNTTVSSNSAAAFGGGGIYNLGASATLNLITSTVSGNNVLATGGGGGIFNNGGTVNLTNSTVSGNDANADGGGINNNSGTLTVTNSTISGNNALTGPSASGGGITNFGALTVTNSTISGNHANLDGGGIFDNHSSGSVTLTSVTITNNFADADNNTTGTGGGIFIFATSLQPLLRNTIVAGNFNENGASDAADDIAGTVNNTSSFNLIGTGGAGGLTNGVDNNQVGVVNPGLGALANNGGPGFTHALLAGSPALDSGSDSFVTAPPFLNTSPITDQRGTGFPRIRDAADINTTQTVDIGAFEADPSVEDIANKVTSENVALPTFVFNIGDSATAFTDVTATSGVGDQTLVPNANILVLPDTASTRKLSITPAAGQSGTATITVTVIRGSLSMSDTFVLTVNPASATPVINNLANDTSTFTEDGPAVLLDTSTAATVTDDQTDLNGGNLTVSTTGNEVTTEDVLGISTAGTVTVSSGVVSVGGMAIGNVTSNGTGGNDLVVTFNTTDATPANISTLMQALTYFNSNTANPSTLQRTIAVSVNDTTSSGSVNVFVNITPQNDTPALDLDVAIIPAAERARITRPGTKLSPQPCLSPIPTSPSPMWTTRIWSRPRSP